MDVRHVLGPENHNTGTAIFFNDMGHFKITYTLELPFYKYVKKMNTHEALVTHIFCYWQNRVCDIRWLFPVIIVS